LKWRDFHQKCKIGGNARDIRGFEVLKSIKVSVEVHEELMGLARLKRTSVDTVLFHLLKERNDESLEDRVSLLEEEMGRMRQFMENATGGTYG
jgi:hypothetical protein